MKICQDSRNHGQKKLIKNLKPGTVFKRPGRQDYYMVLSTSNPTEFVNLSSGIVVRAYRTTTYAKTYPNACLQPGDPA